MPPPPHLMPAPCGLRPAKHLTISDNCGHHKKRVPPCPRLHAGRGCAARRTPQSGLDLPARAKYPPARRNARTGAAGRVWWYFIDMSMADNYHQSMNAEQVLQKALMMENAEAEKFIFSALEKGDITGKELQDAVHQRLLNDEPINLKCLMQSPSIITRWWARQARKDGHRYPLA